VYCLRRMRVERVTLEWYNMYIAQRLIVSRNCMVHGGFKGKFLSFPEIVERGPSQVSCSPLNTQKRGTCAFRMEERNLKDLFPSISITHCQSHENAKCQSYLSRPILFISSITLNLCVRFCCWSGKWMYTIHRLSFNSLPATKSLTLLNVICVRF